MTKRITTLLLSAALTLTALTTANAQTKPVGNKPERLEWFRNLGFGMFIHWNVDGTLGGVISHSMVGASDDYLKRYVNDLPKLADLKRTYPQYWRD